MTRIEVQCRSTPFHAAELQIHLLWSMPSRNDIDQPDREESCREAVKAQPSGPRSVERNSSSHGNGFFRSGRWPWTQKSGIGVSATFLTKHVILHESRMQRSYKFPLCKMETVKPRIASFY